MSAVADDTVGAIAGKAPEGRDGRALRAMFLVNVAGAGLPGAIIVAAPAFAERHVLWPDQDHATMTMLGSVWLAIGLVSVLGAFRPRTFAPVLLVQLVYKLVWLGTWVLPALLAGRPLPPAMWIVVGVFVVLVVEFLAWVRPKHFSRPRHVGLTP